MRTELLWLRETVSNEAQSPFGLNPQSGQSPQVAKSREAPRLLASAILSPFSTRGELPAGGTPGCTLLASCAHCVPPPRRQSGYPALTYASSSGHGDVVRLLVDSAASVDAVDKVAARHPLKVDDRDLKCALTTSSYK